MRETFDEYRRELDGMGFSPGEKNELVGRLSRQVSPHRVRFPRAAVAAGVAIALGAGVVTAYATGALGAAAEFLLDVFGEEAAQTETIGDAVRPEGASAAAGGLTVSADAVLGDDTHYVVVYSLTPDDPTLFEDVPRSDEGTVLLGFSNVAIPENEGAAGGGMGAYFYDANPDDASVQYVQQCWAQSEDGLAGTTAYVKFVDLCALDPETLKPMGEPLATGTWELEVPLDYQSSAIALPTGQTVDYEGATVTVTELSVSPLGVMISYDLAGTPDTSQEFPQLNLPVFVNFADGTSFDATWVGGFGDEGHVTKGASFDRIVDVDDIVSVTVGDVTIEVPHA